MIKTNEFLKLIRKYPLVWMDFKNDKEYKAVQKILEELWKITGWDDDNPNVIGDASSAKRELDVLLIMNQNHPVKRELIEASIDNLESKCKDAFNKIQTICKKHQKLNENFKEIYTMKPSDFKSELAKLKFDMFGK